MTVRRIEGLAPNLTPYDIQSINPSEMDDSRKVVLPVESLIEQRYASSLTSYKSDLPLSIDPAKRQVDTLSSAFNDSRPTLSSLGLTASATSDQIRNYHLSQTLRSSAALTAPVRQEADSERVPGFISNIIDSIEKLFNQMVDWLFDREKKDAGKVSKTEDSWLDALKKGNQTEASNIDDEWGNLDRLLHQALAAMRNLLGEAAKASLEDIEELRAKLKKNHTERAEHAEKMAKAIEKAKFSQNVEKVVSAAALSATIGALFTIAAVGNVGTVAVGACVGLGLILAVCATDRLTGDHIKKLVSDALAWGLDQIGLSKFTGQDATADNIAGILGMISGAVEVLSMAAAGFITGAIQAIASGAQALSQGYSAYRDYGVRKFEAQRYGLDMEDQKLSLKLQDGMGRQTALMKKWLNTFAEEQNLTTKLLTDLIKNFFRDVK